VLIASSRHKAGDIEAWNKVSARDRTWAAMPAFRAREERAEMDVVRFARQSCYASVSWGKDSVVLADLIARVAPHVPIVHIRCEPIDSPECADVRDEFLALHPHAIYDEITVYCRLDASGAHATGTIERGFREAGLRHGLRYLTGIRAQESAGREWRRRRMGSGGDRSCAPLIDWSASDVWAYLSAHDLPIHPVYAMSMSGALDRDRLRVSWIGLQHGTGMGRREWEQAYYSDVLALSATQPVSTQPRRSRLTTTTCRN